MHRIMVTAVLAAVVALTSALSWTPAHSAEAATPNDTARFLAGLPPAPNSPLATLAGSTAWTQHARSFDTIFGLEDKHTLSKVRAFAAARLTDPHSTMLYMFSGPDFLYATSFFPHASTYVLSGLEPVGDIPQLTDLPRPAVDQTLRHLQGSLYTILNLSFFITKKMKSELSEGPVFGTLPILYVFLARTGKTIHEASFVSLDGDGNFISPNDPAPAAKRGGTDTVTHGVRIVFSDGNGPRQTLYYFSTNLADDGVKHSGFLAFCAKLGTADSLLKSASYLLHSGGFNTVRSFLLDHSATVLQDDSGIPLAYFEAKNWRLQPFGRYLGPIAIFPHAYQPHMAELFARGAVPLDFGIGYRWRQNESNLLLAERTTQMAAGEAANASLTTSVDTVPGVPVGSPEVPAWAKVHPKPVESASAAPPPPPPRTGWQGVFGFFRHPY